MPIQAADPVTIAQHQEPEANVDLVTSITVNANAQLLLTTPVGQNDNRMVPTEFIRWTIGPGVGESGGKYVLDTPSLPVVNSALDSDYLIIAASGTDSRIRKSDFFSGMTGTTNLDHTIAGDGLSIDIESSTGTPTTVLVANGTRTGWISQFDWATFNGKLDNVDMVVSGNATSVTVDTDASAGAAQQLPVASGLVAGVLSAADWARFDAASGAAIDLATTYAPTAVTVTNTGGTDATINAATTQDAGVITAADWIKLRDIETNANNYVHPNHTGDISSTGDGVTQLNPQVVQNTNIADNAVDEFKIANGSVTTGKIANDAVTTNKIAPNTITLPRMQSNSVGQNQIVAGSVTFAKMQAILAQSFIANPTGATATPTNVVQGALTPGSGAANDSAIGFNAAGDLIETPIGAISSSTSRKELYDTLAPVTGATTIDFDAGTGDNKNFDVTGPTQLTLNQSDGVRQGEHVLTIVNTGNHDVTFVTGLNPSGNPVIPYNATTVLKLFRDHNGFWHW